MQRYQQAAVSMKGLTALGATSSQVAPPSRDSHVHMVSAANSRYSPVFPTAMTMPGAFS